MVIFWTVEVYDVLCLDVRGEKMNAGQWLHYPNDGGKRAQRYDITRICHQTTFSQNPLTPPLVE
jgi:hypothetical protein